MRDSCGKSVQGETPQAHAEEAREPPAESECLEWKSDVRGFINPHKTETNLIFIEVHNLQYSFIFLLTGKP